MLLLRILVNVRPSEFGDHGINIEHHNGIFYEDDGSTLSITYLVGIEAEIVSRTFRFHFGKRKVNKMNLT